MNAPIDSPFTLAPHIESPQYDFESPQPLAYTLWIITSVDYK